MNDPELPDTEEFYRLIVESALDYAIFTMDARGIITSWPPGAAAVFGWSTEEIVGRPFEMTFTPEDVAAGVAQKELLSAAETGVGPDVRWHVRKDGARVFIEGWTRAMRGADGEVRGFLKIGQDVTQRRSMEAALRGSEERFRTLVVTVPQLVFRSMVTGERTWGSPQWEIYTGLIEAASLGYGWLDAVHPDDKEATIAAWQTAQTTGQYYIEHRIRRATDAEYRWHQTRALPTPESADGEREWVGTSSDVHELRQLHEEQKVLLAELQHRTRNLLGVVQSIMHQTAAASDSVQTFAQKLDDRLAALSRVQGLLSATNRNPITIGALVRMELDALGLEAERDRIVLEGPAVALPNTAIQTLALALHELLTNARKYGALATDQGRLGVTWRLVSAAGEGRRLLVEWLEKGTAQSPAKPRGGFGRRLIEQALPSSLGARTNLEINEAGVRCSIELTLPQ